jgi:ribosomal protein L7Ae-like RNA K-turn-binding protein
MFRRRRRLMREKSRRSEALAFLGLARRAGAVVKGTDATRRALRAGEVRLVVLAEDGSEKQREKVVPLAVAKGIPWVQLGTMDELGAALGAGPLAATGVTERQFAGEIRKRSGRE